MKIPNEAIKPSIAGELRNAVASSAFAFFAGLPFAFSFWLGWIVPDHFASEVENIERDFVTLWSVSRNPGLLL